NETSNIEHQTTNIHWPGERALFDWMFGVGCWLLDVRPFSQMERILIIEDETPMRTALADVLEGEGYRALTAADGESGLRKAVEEKPDLILLDIMMPRLDGY